MITKYEPEKIEAKWQKKWEQLRLYEAKDDSKLAKFYCLDMFPYPSGDGLHVGHFKGYSATDVISRFFRMKGYNVLHPMGWDAFGLPAENYAIKTGIHPKTTTAKNIAKIKSQMKIAGFSYDWSREINTTDPTYYKWTQWIFLKLYEKDLAYEAVVPINFCPKDKTGLANEEVVSGKCERCGTPVVKKSLRQWILKITHYADKLLADLDGLDWPESIVQMQKNWIGRSEGAGIKFQIPNSKLEIEVFTTRPDTLFGATYLVLAPEHDMVTKITAPQKKAEVDKYVALAMEKTDLERTELAKIKTGVFTGAYAINPADSKQIPVWVADYVLASYGAGAIMGVPGQDDRDWEFAEKFDLPIVRTVTPPKRFPGKAYLGDGPAQNSGFVNGLMVDQAKAKVIEWLEGQKVGKRQVKYKLRDWIFSRQRYWGEPIPLVHCKNCGVVPLSEEDLPLRLPDVDKYQPTGTGESPLAAIDEWVNTKCPKCGGLAKRETNTMPQWAGSCWYYIAYVVGKNSKFQIPNSKLTDLWLPVDWYVGGAEHAVLHLLYARFWHKFLFDIGVVSTKEPFAKLRNVGLVLAPDGQKMSKSRGNVITPDDICKKYGADSLRLYECFMGPFGQSISWDPSSIEGVWRFLNRVWQLVLGADKNERSASGLLERASSKLILKVEADIREMKFNTAVSAMMEFVNLANRNKSEFSLDIARKFLIVLAPFAPHLTEELWQRLRRQRISADKDPRGSALRSIHQEAWPDYDEGLAKSDNVEIVVQINGKVRDTLLAERGISQEEAEKMASESQKVAKYLEGAKVKKVIWIQDRLLNFVIFVKFFN